ncbi:prepilin peptidase [Lentzea sp. NPDC058436]|uniref:prepilin peptidase n=1 Tax=Lentzea sp. NPDC058436 TaxID=3346499 RepID=UPI00365A27EB
MPGWITYGLLGAAAGPFVMTYVRAATHQEQLAKRAWMPSAAASGFLCAALSWVAVKATQEANALSWFVIVGLLLALIDLIEHRLPHRINGVLLVGTVVQLLVPALIQSDFDPLVRAAQAAAAAIAGGLAVYVFSRQGLGFGDVVLLAPVAFVLGWFGWYQLFAGLMSAFVIAAVSMRVLRSNALALGPFLIAGAVGAILLT